MANNKEHEKNGGRGHPRANGVVDTFSPKAQSPCQLDQKTEKCVPCSLTYSGKRDEEVSTTFRDGPDA